MADRLTSKGFQIWAAIGACLVTLLVAWLTGWPRPVEAIDERQGRLDVAAPLPAGGLALEQTFQAQHDGLSAVEHLLVVYGADEGDSDTRGPSVLTLRLLNTAGEQIHAASWDVEHLEHNDPLRLSFPPLYDSAGQSYRLRLEGSDANRATVWAFSLDGYARGEMTYGGEVQPGDLKFETTYRYALPAALADLWRLTSENASLLALSLLTLFLPGLALMPRLPWLRRDPGVQLALALAGSLVLIPIAWLWLTVLGGRWSGPALWLALGGSAVVAWARLRRGPRWTIGCETVALGLILLLGFAGRLLAVRDLVLPSWVDSPQHVMISQLMMRFGQVLSNYRPIMPVDRYWYHFGLHAWAASMGQMIDALVPVENTGLLLAQLLLVPGQLLNALAPLAVYGGTVLLTGRRGAGLVAAFFVALVSLFPAYYISWGRYTQLTGMLILPPLMGVCLKLFGDLGRSTWSHLWRPVLWAGLALGGLFLVHARVWVFAAVWIVFLATLSLLTMRHGRGSRLGWLILVGAAGALVSAPWLVRVGGERLAPLLGRLEHGSRLGNYNGIPWLYMSSGLEPLWYGLAVAAVFVAAWVSLRPPKTESPVLGSWPILLLAGWFAAVTALINSERIGVPTFGLVNNNAWVISLFLPTGVALGWLGDLVFRWAFERPLWRLAAGVGLAAGLTWTTPYGLRKMAAVYNPVGQLVYVDDLVMLEWAERHVPADGLVAANSLLWLGEHWAGSDAAYWLPLLAGRETTIPLIGYSENADYWELTNAFNMALDAVEDWDLPETLALLQERGVTHIMIGERGGVLSPEKLLPNGHYRLLETNGAAWLFEVIYGT